MTSVPELARSSGPQAEFMMSPASDDFRTSHSHPLLMLSTVHLRPCAVCPSRDTTVTRPAWLSEASFSPIPYFPSDPESLLSADPNRIASAIRDTLIPSPSSAITHDRILFSSQMKRINTFDARPVIELSTRSDIACSRL